MSVFASPGAESATLAHLYIIHVWRTMFDCLAAANPACCDAHRSFRSNIVETYGTMCSGIDTPMLVNEALSSCQHGYVLDHVFSCESETPKTSLLHALFPSVPI